VRADKPDLAIFLGYATVLGVTLLQAVNRELLRVVGPRGLV